MADLVNTALKERGASARSVSIDVVGHDGLIRDIRAGRIPSYDRVWALFDYLGIDLYMGENLNPLDASVAIGHQILAPIMPGPDRLAHDPNQTLPHHGLAKCSAQGWADDDKDREQIPRPNWVSDDRAFWVSATGHSMVPEGIRSGDFCLISPGRAPQPGDRVWIREATADARVSIKRLVELTPNSAIVRGWLPAQDSEQADFVEERPIKALAELYPVIGVYRGRLGKKDVDVQFIPDPRAGQMRRNDGLIPVDLMTDSIGENDISSFPPSFGFPAAWLSKNNMRPGNLRLVGVTDDWLEPALPKGSVALVDTSRKALVKKGFFAVQTSKSVLTRQVEPLPDGSFIVNGLSPTSQPTLVSGKEDDQTQIIGAIVWHGTSF